MAGIINKIVKKIFHEAEGDCVLFDLGSAYVKALHVSGSQIKSFLFEKNKGQPIKTVVEWLKQENLMNRPAIPPGRW